MASLVCVETTVETAAQARRLSQRLVESRLCACVNVQTVRSTYWWKGRIERGRELLLVCKTTGAKAKRLARLIAAQHPYEVPYIATHALEGVNAAYVHWVVSVTASAPIRS